MTAVYILAGALLVLFLIGQIRVGGRAAFNAQGFFVWLRVGRIYIQVFPLKPKKEKKKRPQKPKKQKKPKKPKEEKPPTPLLERAGGALAYAQALLPVVLKAAGRLWSSLRVDDLELVLTAGANDPADAAILYGRAAGALGALWHPLTRTFHVKSGTARVNMEFQEQGMTVYGAATLSMKIGQIVWISLRAGCVALVRTLAARKRLKKIRQEQRKAV